MRDAINLADTFAKLSAGLIEQLLEAKIDEDAGIVTLDCVQRDPHDTLARYVYGKDAQFEPGTQWRYSNTNYTLLGMVIEAAAAMPLAEAYRTHIYEPLGMTSTFLDCYEDPVVEVVNGYTELGMPWPMSAYCMNP